MKKYLFMVFHQDYTGFLNELQEMGVLHVKERGSANIEGGELREKMLLLNRIEDAIKFLGKKLDPKINAGVPVVKSGAELLHHFEAIRHGDELLSQFISVIEKDVAVLEPWGTFDWTTIERLEQEGWHISFFSVSSRMWKPEWETIYNAFQIAQSGSNVLFVTVTRKNQPIDLEADKVKLPRKRLRDELAEIIKLKKEKVLIDNELKNLAATNLTAFMDYKNVVQQEFDFDKVVFNTDKVAEDKVALIEGYLPVDKEVEFQKFLNEKELFFEATIPDQSDRVPVLLKNNWFARLFEPIGELYTLPNYNELDLTGLYAPFYWLFFGFCLGDLGYGFILTILGFIMSKLAKPKMQSIFRLIGFLGLSTMLFGFLSGTCFGMNLYEMRLGFYASLDDLLKSKDTSVNKLLFNLSLVLGGIQILYGMFVKVANEIYQGGWRSALSTIGWIIIILGFAINYALKKLEVDPATAGIIFPVVLFIGFLGAFVFNNPARNIFSNMAFGLWDAYNMATGLMGDLLSYIRLFALAISTGVLGYVFNSLAVSMAPDIPVLKYIVILLILAIGHSINILMGILGSFVHPMRLTFVEFYKNAGFSGGGKKYIPFKRSIK